MAFVAGVKAVLASAGRLEALVERIALLWRYQHNPSAIPPAFPLPLSRYYTV